MNCKAQNLPGRSQALLQGCPSGRPARAKEALWDGGWRQLRVERAHLH